MLLITGYNFALHISVASIAIDFVLAVASLLTGTSSSNCAFAVDCFLDVFSNAILVWRFSGQAGKDVQKMFSYAADASTRLTSSRPNFYQSLSHQSLLQSDKNNNRNRYSDNEANNESATHRKELLSCIGLGIMFIVSGIIVIAKSALDLAMSDTLDDLEPDMNGLPGILHVTSVATVICGLLALGKYVIYRHTESKAMCLEAINSSISAVLALVIVISTMIIEYDNDMWILDPIVSILFSVFMICYGIYEILKSQNKLNQYDNCQIQDKKKKFEYIIIP